ncbi:MAG: glycosyltransferase [Methanoregula sp.]|nr:glycosyltransferase [Methanoregula sp.]
MRILFVVCGEGLGHASRCLNLGHFLEGEGHEVHFAGYGKAYAFMDQHPCGTLHGITREVCLEGEGGFFSLKKTLWESKWIVLDMVRSVLSIRSLIRKHGFDCVVCDTMYGGVLAARLQGVPVIFITNQTYFCGPGGVTNPVWKILNFTVRRYLRLANHVIIPDFPAPHSVAEYNLVISDKDLPRYTFTGPLLDLDPARFAIAKRTIFTSFGGEPYKLPMYRMLREIADERPNLCFEVFSTGPVHQDSSENFVSYGYVPSLFEYLAQAHVAIVHGGLTTLHEALIFEKPVLVIMDPKHPEQQNNAQKIVDMGAGIAVDGLTVTREVLEQKLAEAMALSPRTSVNGRGGTLGRKTAAGIIVTVANRKRRRYQTLYKSFFGEHRDRDW